MLDDIDLDRIEQKKVRKYIEGQIDEGKHQFSEIHPSWKGGMDLSSYRKDEKIFFLKGNIQDTWQGFVKTDPSISWNGRKISYGLLLQKFPCGIFYNHDPISSVDTGQVYFLNLKLLMGIFNIPVAFEMITVDREKRVVEFSYIEGNRSAGVQQVKFMESGDERTEIIHISYYKSDSHFRDKWLYPFFHRILVKDFYRNMKRLHDFTNH